MKNIEKFKLFIVKIKINYFTKFTKLTFQFSTWSKFHVQLSIISINTYFKKGLWVKCFNQVLLFS